MPHTWSNENARNHKPWTLRNVIVRRTPANLSCAKGETLLTDDSTSSPEGVEHLEDLAAERDTVPLPGVGCKPVSQPNMGQPVPLPCAGCKTVPQPCAGRNPAPQPNMGRKLVAQSSVGFKAALCSPGMARESILRFHSKFADLLVLIQAFSASLGVYWSSLTSNRTNILPNLPQSRDFGSRG